MSKMENRNTKTIYISCLPNSVTEEDLLSIFENYGLCVSCQLNSEECTAYVEFDNETSAKNALSMNGIEMGVTHIQIVIAYNQTFDMKQINSRNFLGKINNSTPTQIFVGNIGSNVDEAILEGGFEHLGTIIDAKVIRDPDGKPKGYGFVTFSSEFEARNAIEKMNETFFHDEKIKCSWGKNKTNVTVTLNKNSARSLQDILLETPKSYTNVFVTGENVTQEMLEPHFVKFGTIKNIKAFPKNNQSFINYYSHEAAANAIHQMNGFLLDNVELKCSWAIKSEKPGKKIKFNRQPPVKKPRKHLLPKSYSNITTRQDYESNYDSGYGGGGGGLPQYQQPTFTNSYPEQTFHPYSAPAVYPNEYQYEDNFNFPSVRSHLIQPKPIPNVQPLMGILAQPKPALNRVAANPYRKPILNKPGKFMSNRK